MFPGLRTIKRTGLLCWYPALIKPDSANGKLEPKKQTKQLTLADGGFSGRELGSTGFAPERVTKIS